MVLERIREKQAERWNLETGLLPGGQRGHSSEQYVGHGESLAQRSGTTAQRFTSDDLGKSL